jgi:DNA-binding NtrC family response regulator
MDDSSAPTPSRLQVLCYARDSLSDPRSPAPRDSATATLERQSAPPLGVLVRVLGPGAPPAHALRHGVITIGAGSKADVLVDSDTVSRNHLEMSLVREGVRVRDLGSRNGTFYLGQRVETMVLAPGSRIRIGSVEVSIEPDLTSLDFDGEESTSYRGLLGVSPASRRLFAMLARLEGSLVSVLVTGESGVGKELIAAALHEGSSVAEGPFVARNCAAMSRELVLSELFGHKRGSFTGAQEARIGAFEAADGGTLFLDEVGELPLDIQPMLLRALESGEVLPVGATHPTKVKVRVIAATNRRLDEATRAGTFREDLYYRLAVVQLRVLPLRERPEDVAVLARHFAKLSGMGELPPDVLAEWLGRAWPGNVRELKNAVDAYAALGGMSDDRPPPTRRAASALRALVDLDKPFMDQREAIAEEFTRAYLLLLLERTGGNQSEAARISGVERSHLRKMLSKHGLLGP